MKIINSIFCIYLILLSCLPCVDIGVNSAMHNESELVSKSEKHSHSTSNDSCTPFCVCNCCGSQIVKFSPSVAFHFSISSEGIKKQLPTYKTIFSSNFYGSIWQPPQINDVV